MQESLKKKMLLFHAISIVGISLLLSGCGKSSEAEKYSDNLTQYRNIADYANANCKVDKYKVEDIANRYVVILSEIQNIDTISSEVLTAEQNFSYLWIEDGYLIFWNDETKTEGLLYSDNPKDSIKQIREWYQDLEYEKITDDFYLIGSWRHK